MLKNSKRGDIFDFDYKNRVIIFEESATVLYKDELGVFIRFESFEYTNNQKIPFISVAYYNFN